ncbi:MAG: T9SS type A sorting domain-containing protein [Ignavibacteriales bacterium]|nr:T9SS type A sorting domain-containing protein [Ignavibacteriales bacterium]
MVMIRTFVLVMLLASPLALYSQTVLEADGPGNTYELISSVLAPGGDAVENPECVHPQFGRHIAEVWDSVLNRYVFEFYSHVTPDNDRCINFDRQRIEIKTYESSPDNLKGVVGETVTYKWKFKIAIGYQPSSSFTHLHQIKPVGGDDGNPLFTLTPRKGSPNKMELIHDNTTKVAIVNLSLFEGVWVECTETIKIGASGTYSMLIKRVSDGTVILSYSNANIMTIRPDNGFIRPKWGIYRSLTSPSDLRDEAVRFAGFSIQETVTGVDGSQCAVPADMLLHQNYPNPFNPVTTIAFTIPKSSLVTLKVCSTLGQEVATLAQGQMHPGDYSVRFDGSAFSSGIYFYQLNTEYSTSVKKMALIK